MVSESLLSLESTVGLRERQEGQEENMFQAPRAIRI